MIDDDSMGPPAMIDPDDRPPPPEDSGGVLSGIWKRRVPYFVGAYVAATAGIVQFVDWLTGRYTLSPALTDLTLSALALLLPTAVMLAWRHGQPGRNHWTSVERLGVPANLLGAAAILFFVFQGQALGAMTTTVVVEDEEGVTIERVVPKAEFRRHVALFNFDNESGDAELDWLQCGIPRGIWADLRQDFFMDVREGFALSEQLAHGRLKEMRGDCQGALADYGGAIEIDPGSVGWRRHVARCLRELGRLEEAVDELTIVLESTPYSPLALTELGRVQQARGDVDSASAAIEKALDTWSDADESYAPAEEARALAVSLGAG